MIRRILPLLVAGLAAVPPSWAAGGPMLGFQGSRAAEQRELEARFDAQLDAANLRRFMERLAARPHHVGSPDGKANAEYMAELFESWGYDARIEEFRVLFPTPRVRRLELTAPERFTASLAELPEAERPAGALPPYNAYSIDGDVAGELVYVNYGVPDDYEELERRGIDVKDKIVLARYGGSWRGIKPKVAAEHGAVGCILYSDPRDDGYFVGDVYPEGGYRPEDGAQRGSVADMPLFPGDPLTPFAGATAGAERLTLAEAPTLTKIPVLPISQRDARPLLAALGGPVAPEAWRGALPLTYHLGPGPATVHLELAFDWDQAPAYDVIAVLAGVEEPDRWILRGNHHDAWVNGAADPTSGLVALLEEARAIGTLAAEGWKPKRTIVYAAWDAEEPGLLGSTEWVEEHAEELERKAVAYVNTDGNSRGFLRMGGSHTLEKLMNEVAREVEDPQTGGSVAGRARARLAVEGEPEEQELALEVGDLPLSPLGSGSDYTPFLQHLGIASLNLSFGGEGDYGQYHSAHDTIDHFTRFMDPGFEYGVALARVAGRVVLRLAGADVLPFEPRGLLAKVETYVTEVIELADEMRQETERRNRRIEKGMYRAAADPAETYVPPEPEEPVPHLNFAPLQNALTALTESVRRFEAVLEPRLGDPLPVGKRDALNGVLFRLERALTRPEGLPRRPWFRHHVYAPGFYTGYGVKTLPGVREAIEERLWPEAEEQIGVAAGVLTGFAAEVDRARELVEDWD
jgi:N-acetylated-alpha-linked acidic dipeptidase